MKKSEKKTFTLSIMLSSIVLCLCLLLSSDYFFNLQNLRLINFRPNIKNSHTNVHRSVPMMNMMMAMADDTNTEQHTRTMKKRGEFHQKLNISIDNMKANIGYIDNTEMK